MREKPTNDETVDEPLVPTHDTRLRLAVRILGCFTAGGRADSHVGLFYIGFTWSDAKAANALIEHLGRKQSCHRLGSFPRSSQPVGGTAEMVPVLETLVGRVLPAIKLKPTLGIGLTKCDVAFVDTGSPYHFFFPLAARIGALSFFV